MSPAISVATVPLGWCGEPVDHFLCARYTKPTGRSATQGCCVRSAETEPFDGHESTLNQGRLREGRLRENLDGGFAAWEEAGYEFLHK